MSVMLVITHCVKLAIMQTLLYSHALILGMDGYLLWLSGSGRIFTIRQNLPPAGLHVSHRIGLALITKDVMFDFS